MLVLNIGLSLEILAIGSHFGGVLLGDGCGVRVLPFLILGLDVTAYLLILFSPGLAFVGYRIGNPVRLFLQICAHEVIVLKLWTIAYLPDFLQICTVP